MKLIETAGYIEAIQSKAIQNFITPFEKEVNIDKLFAAIDGFGANKALVRSLLLLEERYIKEIGTATIDDYFYFNEQYRENLDYKLEGNEISIISVKDYTDYVTGPIIKKEEEISRYGIFQPVILYFGKALPSEQLKADFEIKGAPGVLVAYYLRKDNLQQQKEALGLIKDLALLGAAQIELLNTIIAYQKSQTLYATTRVIIATADLLAVGADAYCQGNNSEYCKEWRAISFYVSIGLMTTTVAELSINFLTRGRLINQFADYPNIQKWIEDSNIPENIIAKLENYKTTGNTTLLNDLNTDLAKEDFLLFLRENPEGVEAWGALRNTGKQTDLDWLSQINEWLNLNVTYSRTGNVVQFTAPNGHQFAKVENGNLFYNYGGFGGDILVSPDKVTTVLGKFQENFGDPNSFGTWIYLQRDGGLPDGVISRVVNTTPPSNSIAFLDLPAEQYNALLNNHIKDEIVMSTLFNGNTSNLNLIDNLDPWGSEINSVIQNQILPNASTSEIDLILNAGRNNGNQAFWDIYNLPFLEGAFQRGDDIRLVSDNALNSPTRSGTYKKELEEIENRLMQEYNYQYNEATKTYEKQ